MFSQAKVLTYLTLMCLFLPTYYLIRCKSFVFHSYLTVQFSRFVAVFCDSFAMITRFCALVNTFLKKYLFFRKILVFQGKNNPADHFRSSVDNRSFMLLLSAMIHFSFLHLLKLRHRQRYREAKGQNIRCRLRELNSQNPCYMRQDQYCRYKKNSASGRCQYRCF